MVGVTLYQDGYPSQNSCYTQGDGTVIIGSVDLPFDFPAPETDNAEHANAIKVFANNEVISFISDSNSVPPLKKDDPATPELLIKIEGRVQPFVDTILTPQGQLLKLDPAIEESGLNFYLNIEVIWH